MKNRIEKIVNISKAFSSETRLKMVIDLLARQECNVSLMPQKLSIAQPKVSQHLPILKNVGIIESYRRGT